MNGSGKQGKASASFLKKRSKKLLSDKGLRVERGRSHQTFLASPHALAASRRCQTDKVFCGAFFQKSDRLLA
jgi:hypothetical protein